MRIVLAMPGVFPMESMRNKNLDRLVEQFLARVAKQLLRLGVCEHDAALFVDNYDGIGRRLEQIAEF